MCSVASATSTRRSRWCSSSSASSSFSSAGGSPEPGSRSASSPRSSSWESQHRWRQEIDSGAMAQVLPAERDLRRIIGDGDAVPDGEVEGLSDHDLIELYRSLVLL